MARLILALAVLAGAVSQRDDAMKVSLVRFYSATTSTTMVEGTCEVRLDSLVAPGAAATALRIEVVVRDSVGLELYRNEWGREVPRAAVRQGATLVESFRFSAAPGRYRMTVRASGGGGRALERLVEFRSYASSPIASDLLVASGVRRPASETEELAPGEVLRAGLVMQTAPQPTLRPTEPLLSYYAELYPQTSGGLRGEMTAEVVAGDGRIVIATRSRPVEVERAGGLSRGSLDLTGLPEGEYTLRLRFRFGDSTVVAEAPFAMGSLATVLAQETAPPVPQRAEDQLFDALGAAQLDSMFAPLVHLLAPEEYSIYGTLTADGRRRFLKAAWSRRDPTPETPDNPAMLDYYRAVTYANEAFREPGAGGVTGWRTDRGRIYLRNGRPDEVLRRPTAPQPYEVWKYTRDRTLYFVFLDRSGFGGFRLIGSNDRREPSQMDWERSFSNEGLQDIMQFIR
jgi:GWxTD domain-containing protein